jgi:hypothetical protein
MRRYDAVRGVGAEHIKIALLEAAFADAQAIAAEAEALFKKAM